MLELQARVTVEPRKYQNLFDASRGLLEQIKAWPDEEKFVWPRVPTWGRNEAIRRKIYLCLPSSYWRASGWSYKTTTTLPRSTGLWT